MHKLRELIMAALAVSRGNLIGAANWEGHLSAGFDTFLGGQNGLIEGSCQTYILRTIVDRTSIFIQAYGGIATPDFDRRICTIVGYGVFMRCLLGNPDEVYGEIEDSYRTAADTLGAEEFKKNVGKHLPYSVATDTALVGFSRGVVDISENENSYEDPFVIPVEYDGHLKNGAYCDLRSFNTVEDLLSGICGLWTAIISEDEHDWSKFINTIRPAFVERMEDAMPF